MIWKKNAVSYIMWFLYVLLAEILVLICVDEIGQSFGMPVYVNALLGFFYAALVGLLVLLIRKVWTRISFSTNKYSLFVLVAEAVACVLLLAVGLGLRISNMDAMTQGVAYFESAQVTYGHEIPQVVHGAVYLYLQVLHGLFLMVGNHFVAGVWLQIVLQMLAFLVLYFVVRKLSGVIAALFTLGFGMCSPMMVQYALTLSPEVLYFLLVVLVTAVYTISCSRKLYPAVFLLFGGLAAVMTYLDIAGILLLLFAAVIPFSMYQEDVAIGRRMAALGCAVGSYAGVFFGTILIDAFLSGKLFGNVLKAWAELYSYKFYEVANTFTPFSAEEIILWLLLVVGIFSFWCDKKGEVLSVSMCSVIVLIAIALRFTEEMPGELYYIMMLVVMSGTFVGQIFSPGMTINVAENVSEAMNDDVMVCSVEESKAESVELPEAEPVNDKQQDVVQEQAKPAIQFIENPLPLPKRHQKKVFDYAMELTDETAEFDIEVSDDDDYDK